MAISSLALHHLVCDDDKIKFYRKIYNCLAPGGVFYNVDVVLGASAPLQARYMEQWREYMLLQVPVEEIEQKWLPQHYDEDHPASLMSQLAWLQAIGFVEVDFLWKYNNFAVYGGRKPAAA